MGELDQKYKTVMSAGAPTKQSRTQRAKLFFSVSRMEEEIRSRMLNGQHMGKGAPIYLAAVMEYLLTEILEPVVVAGYNNRHRINHRDVFSSIYNDPEMHPWLLSSISIPSAGVYPHIHDVLKVRSKSNSKKQKGKTSTKKSRSSNRKEKTERNN